jgi:predicted DNA-binding antitoxin AbrB/MazE fold protein
MAGEGGREFIMSTIRAVYENGVFRPMAPIDLPEQSVVEFEPRPVKDELREKALDEVYEALSRRFHSGRHDLAERHDEHQP